MAGYKNSLFRTNRPLINRCLVWSYPSLAYSNMALHYLCLPYLPLLITYPRLVSLHQNTTAPHYDCTALHCTIYITIHYTTLKYSTLHAVGRGSSIGWASAWYAEGRGFDPHVRQNILSLTFGHENVSMTILFLPLIQEGQLSVTGERMGTKYCVARLTDRARNDLKCVEGP